VKCRIELLFLCACPDGMDFGCIHTHDNLIIGVEDETLVISKQKRSVFDLQHREVVAGTLKQALIFEQKMDQAGKKDMPV